MMRLPCRVYALSVSLVVLTGACTVSRVPQQDRIVPAETPAGSVALQHLRALIAEDWQTSTRLTHPAELASIRAAFSPIFAGDTTGFLAARVLEAPRQLDLSSLSDVAFTARLFAFHVKLASHGTALERFTDAQILAVAQPFPDTAYVVYRWILPDTERPIRGAQVKKLQRDQGRWWLSMLGDFEDLRELLTPK